MHPELPGDDKVLDNPYTYTDYRSASTREARESIFGESAGDLISAVRRTATARLGSRGDERATATPRVEVSMAGRGSGPDFVEALARGLDVLTCFDARHPTMIAERGGGGRRAGPTHGPAAAAHARRARLRADRRQDWVRPHAQGARPRHRVHVLARALGPGPAAPGGAGRPDRRVVVDGPAGRLRHRLRGPGVGAQDHRPAGRHRHPVPGRADLAGQGAAGRLVRAAGRRDAGPAQPVRAAAAAGRRRRPAGRAGPGSRPGLGAWPTRSSLRAYGRWRRRCGTPPARSGRR